MSLSSYTDAAMGESWSTPATEQAPEPTVESALEKEKIIKDILSLRDGLRGLLVRVTEVEADNEKLAKDNEMLSVYIDNLTRNSVVAAGTKR
ncbi:hypothetical protein I302_100133 [Kwoniella bestiolae CBS 10118]|uniref:Short coiled-coil protein n=1 Tax=Kwoniella bestiolae CBS 10118 TaxID=1296100 RepID=A0A1B9G475_9TREE|nr:hypothetical protein I302_03509 [Kwoniella bestiolae CBS 10118]OCF25835.1 hypothetical protein I302_03509 [Kwoniella bestiolae CBS 10118]